MNGCTNTASIKVTVNPLPVLNVSPLATPSICYGNNVSLTASGAASYSWSPPTGLTCTACLATTAGPLTTTTYYVAGTSGAGCIDSMKVVVSVALKILANISGKDTICSGTSTILTASGGTSYLWNTGATTAALNVNPLTNTTYSVLVKVGSCLDSSKVTVVVNPSPVVTINGTDSICVGGNTILTATGGADLLLEYWEYN